MFAKIVLLGVGLIVCLGEAKDMKECAKLFEPKSIYCCKANAPRMDLEERFKECFEQGTVMQSSSGDPQKPPSPVSQQCDVERCMAEKRKILKADGTIDKDVLKKSIQTEFASRPAVIKKVIEKCIEGDISKYAPSDFCELIKLHNCITIQTYVECSEWDDSDAGCKEIKELVAKCES